MRVSVWYVGGVALALAGCGQFTTNNTERATLETAATKTGESYVNCVVEASDRYQQTGESSAVILDVSRKACSAARGDYVAADTAYLKSMYMQTAPILEKNLAALDERAKALVEQQVLARKAAAPAAAASVPVEGKKYLDCMRGEGERYASVNEPAGVVAEVAHSRCSATLTDPASAAQLERQGRALVMGMVLDRKVGK